MEFLKHFYVALIFYKADIFIELGDSITVTISYAKLTKLSKKCCHLVCQAEQTSFISLVTQAAEVWSVRSFMAKIFFNKNEYAITGKCHKVCIVLTVWRIRTCLPTLIYFTCDSSYIAT